MRIFEFTDYKDYVRRRIRSLPSQGRGELSRIARHLGIHSTMITHILKGEAHFSLEQALGLADYLALTSLETEFLVALVQWERAGDKRARAFCEAKIDQLKSQALNLGTRISAKNELDEEDRATYYSSWIYSYLRLLTSIERFQAFDALVKELRLPPKRVREVLDFLTSRGLCKEEGGKIQYVGLTTYAEASSLLATRQHLNWRQKTQEKFESLRPQDLVFTYPTTISEEDFKRIREKLVQFIEEFRKTTEPSPSQGLYCLNIDWIRCTSRD